MKATRWLCGLVASGLLAAGGCSASETDELVGGTGGAGTGGGMGASGGTGGGVVGQCDPACGPGQFCSVANQCIDEGTCLEDGDCGVGLECDPATNTCVPGGGCGSHEVTVTPVAPNLLIVLDRSCSMRRDLNNVINIPGPNKWTYAVDAIVTMTTTYVGQIRFGLILFPDTVSPQCQQDAPAVPLGPDNETAIQTILTDALDTNDTNYPDGPCVTNIDTAMQQASQEPEFQDTTRASFALLITDGKQANCSAAGGDAGTTQIITDMNANGVSTFVVGFGGGVDPAQLDIFAIAGGMPLPGSPAYYQADDDQELQQALDTIATATLGCVFELEEVPPEPDDIYVFVNNDPNGVPQDPSHQDGWDYDPVTNQIEFYGPLCDALKDGTITDVDIVFGCPDPTPD